MKNEKRTAKCNFNFEIIWTWKNHFILWFIFPIWYENENQKLNIWISFSNLLKSEMTLWLHFPLYIKLSNLLNVLTLRKSMTWMFCSWLDVLPCLKNVGLVIHYDSNTSTFFSLSSNFHIVNSYSLIHIVNSYIPPNSTSTRFHRNKGITVAWETRTH